MIASCPISQNDSFNASVAWCREVATHATSTVAAGPSARERGPRQATSITIVTARNIAVNSIFAPDARKLVVHYNRRPNSTILEWIEMPITIYGIKNCDTMKKARAWLDGHGV